MNEELLWRITAFFSYWRERHAFIRGLDFAKYFHEANVLLWASLDALSSLWAKNIGKEYCGKIRQRRIFDAFLSRYGGDLFQLVSLPDVWDRVDKGDVFTNQERTLKLPNDICVFLEKVGGRRTPTFKEERQNRSSSDDWSIDRIITEAMEEYPGTNHNQLEEWLVLSRYGAIAYKTMRSSYIHEGRAGKATHGFKLHGFEIQPTYRSALYYTPPIIGFSIEFMLNILERCIHAFEADALALQRDPAPVRSPLS